MARYDDYDDGGGRRGRERPRGELELKPLEVVVDFDNIEKAIRILKRKMAEEGIFREIKKRRFYEKPSEAKKRKALDAERRRRKSLRRTR